MGEPAFTERNYPDLEDNVATALFISAVIT